MFISEDAVKAGQVRVEDVLLQYSDEQIQEMREEVIKIVPHLVYKDPRYKSEDWKDAFDVAVNGVLNRKGNILRSIDKTKTEEYMIYQLSK